MKWAIELTDNTRYLDWMDDLLNVEFHRSHAIRDLQINFTSEVTTGQAIDIRWLSDEHTLSMKGCSGGKQIFAIRAAFEVE